MDATAPGKQVGPGRGGPAEPRGASAGCASRLRPPGALGERLPELNNELRGAGCGMGSGAARRLPALREPRPVPVPGGAPSVRQPCPGTRGSVSLRWPCALPGTCGAFRGKGLGSGRGMCGGRAAGWMDGCVRGINRELQSRGDRGKVLCNTFSLPLRSHLSRNLVISMVVCVENTSYPAPARALPGCPRSCRDTCFPVF